jgi:hypothetical protein
MSSLAHLPEREAVGRSAAGEGRRNLHLNGARNPGYRKKRLPQMTSPQGYGATPQPSAVCAQRMTWIDTNLVMAGHRHLEVSLPNRNILAPASSRHLDYRAGMKRSNQAFGVRSQHWLSLLCGVICPITVYSALGMWLFVLFCFSVLGLELRAYTLSHSTSPFFLCVKYFRDRVSRTVCLGWLQTTVLLISAS